MGIAELFDWESLKEACTRCGRRFRLFAGFGNLAFLGEPEGLRIDGEPVCFDCLDVVTHEIETAFQREPDYQRKLKLGRNDPCPCGSGKKYKKCCLQVERVLGCFRD